jgi:gamma-glutamylcyclotransferase (GGCT)/AIG2-like uncharacterized protein YtfP
MQTNYLFVYGSLVSGFKSPAYEYLTRYFRFLGEAVVKGTMFDMGSFPVATPADTGRFINGELYEIINPADFSFALAQLDDYEGLHPEEGQESSFERTIADVHISSQTFPAWIYWFKGDVMGKPIVESGNMVEYAKNKI